MKKTAIILIIVLTFCISISAQSGRNIAKQNNPSATEGKVLGKVPEYKILGNDLKYLLKLLRPELSLLVDSGEKINVENSKEINKF